MILKHLNFKYCIEEKRDSNESNRVGVLYLKVPQVQVLYPEVLGDW